MSRFQSQRRKTTVVPPVVIPPVDTGTPSGTPIGPEASGTPKAFSLTVIPFADPELINPARGAYSWMGQEQSPPGGSLYMYDRDIYNWHDLEPQKDNYTPFLNLIEQKAAAAKSRGAKYGFRVATAFSGLRVPQYVADGAGVDYSNGFAVPNWNSSVYINRSVALWNAIGARFGNDDRIGVMDISMFGNYGEFHTWDIQAGPYTSCTTANLKTLIDAQVAALPKAQWVQLWGGQDYVKDAVRYSMSLTYGPQNRKMGWRNDCLGSDPFQPNMTGWQVYQENIDRWKTAPIVGELCNIAPDGYSWTNGTFARVLQQTKDNHVSLVGNGNTSEGTYPNFSQAEQTNWQNANKTAGYRIEFRGCQIPSVIESGSHFTFTHSWANVGNAPIYDNWSVQLILKDNLGVTRFTGTSVFNPKGLLPSTTATSKSEIFNTDGLTLPAGSYSVYLKVIDPVGYYAPLKLANQGRQTDGSYLLPQGTVTVP